LSLGNPSRNPKLDVASGLVQSFAKTMDELLAEERERDKEKEREMVRNRSSLPKSFKALLTDDATKSNNESSVEEAIDTGLSTEVLLMLPEVVPNLKHLCLSNQSNLSNRVLKFWAQRTATASGVGIGVGSASGIGAGGGTAAGSTPTSPLHQATSTRNNVRTSRRRSNDAEFDNNDLNSDGPPSVTAAAAGSKQQQSPSMRHSSTGASTAPNASTTPSTSAVPSKVSKESKLGSPHLPSQTPRVSANMNAPFPLLRHLTLWHCNTSGSYAGLSSLVRHKLHRLEWTGLESERRGMQQVMQHMRGKAMVRFVKTHGANM